MRKRPLFTRRFYMKAKRDRITISHIDRTFYAGDQKHKIIADSECEKYITSECDNVNYVWRLFRVKLISDVGVFDAELCITW